MIGLLGWAWIGKAGYLLWREFDWPWSVAWRYGYGLFVDAMYEIGQGSYDELPSPREAIDLDREYWSD